MAQIFRLGSNLEKGQTFMISILDLSYREWLLQNKFVDNEFNFKTFRADLKNALEDEAAKRGMSAYVKQRGPYTEDEKADAFYREHC